MRRPRFVLAALLAAACAGPSHAPGPPPGAWTAVQPGECGVVDVALDELPAGAPDPAALPAGAEPAALALRLNVPAYRLDVLEEGRVTRTITVAVGTPDHPTPTGAFAVTKVVWNPWWVPPPFEWAARERVTPPGPNNPTGRVKLYFGWYLFLHGTPDEASLGHAASHGCVRMANSDAIALARLVHAEASPGVSPALLDSLEANPRRTRTITLETPVPLDIRYDLVETRNGRVEIHEDIYRRRDAAHGVDLEELRAALEASRPVAIPVGENLR